MKADILVTTIKTGSIMTLWAIFRYFTRRCLLILAINMVITECIVAWAASPTQEKDIHLPFNVKNVSDIQLLINALSLIKTEYLQRINMHVLVQKALEGVMSSLDTHSSFLLPEDFKAFEMHISAASESEGLGIDYLVAKEGLDVLRVYDDSPAEHAGVLPGDRIVRWNNKVVNKITWPELEKNLTWKLGEQFILTLEREGRSQPLKSTVIFGTYQLTSVDAHLISNGYGYIRLYSFIENSAIEIAKAILNLEREKPLKGLILDLRNNSGGVVKAALNVADLFIETPEVLLRVKGRSLIDNEVFKAQYIDITHGLPLVVLIDHGSASASEILAGALQDHQRAVVIGEKSYGKGSIQSIFPLVIGEKTYGLKLTTAMYQTPNRQLIQSHGVIPDIRVANKKTVVLGQLDDAVVARAVQWFEKKQHLK